VSSKNFPNEYFHVSGQGQEAGTRERARVSNQLEQEQEQEQEQEKEQPSDMGTKGVTFPHTLQKLKICICSLLGTGSCGERGQRCTRDVRCQGRAEDQSWVAISLKGPYVELVFSHSDVDPPAGVEKRSLVLQHGSGNQR